MHKVCSIALLLAASTLLPIRAFADLISPEDFGATFQVFNQSPSTSEVLYAYDSTSDIFSIDGPLGTAAAPAVLDAYPLTAPFDVTDIVGTFSLTATVDDTGTTLGGSFSWIGESASLGIAANTTLLAGTIASVEFLPSSPVLGFQVISSVDSVDAQIEALYGDIDSALIYCQTCLGDVEFNLNPWNSDIDPSTPVTQTPSIFGSPARVSEPTTLGLAALGLLGFGLVRRRSA